MALPKLMSTFELREGYIYEQERLIEGLADEGQNTDDAFGLLNLLNRSLRLFERYRVFLDRVSSLQER